VNSLKVCVRSEVSTGRFVYQFRFRWSVGTQNRDIDNQTKRIRVTISLVLYSNMLMISYVDIYGFSQLFKLSIFIYLNIKLIVDSL